MSHATISCICSVFPFIQQLQLHSKSHTGSALEMLQITLAINFEGTNMFEKEKIQILPWEDRFRHCLGKISIFQKILPDLTSTNQ